MIITTFELPLLSDLGPNVSWYGSKRSATNSRIGPASALISVELALWLKRRSKIVRTRQLNVVTPLGVRGGKRSYILTMLQFTAGI